jgi:ABC-type phosphate transport system substrate-binding protein
VRIIRSLVAVGAAAAAATAVAVAAPGAMAEPILHGKQVTPAAYDIVGVGSDTTQYVIDQLSLNYNATVKKHSPSDPYFFSWDAVPPAHPLDTVEKVTLKAGCGSELRPDGSSAGISALTSYGNVKYKGVSYPCINFARSSRARKSSDASTDLFVIFASDAVTYATAAKSNVPNNLNLKQLAEIFGCTIPAAHGFAAGTWGALLGSKAKDPKGSPNPVVPQAGSGTLSFWMETALGLATDTEPLCGTAKNDTTVNSEPEENEGIWSGFKKDTANLLFPFSVGSYVSQAYHSKKSCSVKAKAKKGQNEFGCDETGILFLNGISGVAPTVKVKGVPETNPKWNTTPFHRYLYNVVVSDPSTSTHISPLLSKFFGRTGYLCKASNKSILMDYGFEPSPACGT